MVLMYDRALLAINVDGSTGLRFSLAECRKWMIVQAVILQFIITTVDVILMMRGTFPSHYDSVYLLISIPVYALYNKNRTLLGVLSVIFVAELVLLSYILAVVTSKFTLNDDCFVTSSPPLFVAYW